MQLFWLQYGELFCLIGIFAILAMSLNAIVGMTGLLHIGHAGFYAAGAYTAGLIAIYGTQPELGMWNFVIGGGAAMLVAAALSLIIGIPCLRLRGDYLAIATLGFGEVIRMLLAAISYPAPLTLAQQSERAEALASGATWNPPTAIGSATGIRFPDVPGKYFGPEFADYDAGYAKWWLIWLLVIVTYIIFRNIKFSQTGRALMCIREDEIAAKAMGINTPRYKVTAFVISAAFAGLAGALYFHVVKSINPNDFKFMLSIQVLLMVVLGGLGSFLGSFIAAVVLTLLPELLRKIDFTEVEALPAWMQINMGQHKEIVFAILLIVLIRIVPNGILGMREWPAWLGGRKRKEGPADA